MDIKGIEFDTRGKLSSLSVHVVESVMIESENAFRVNKMSIHFTPKNYIDMLEGYLVLLKNKFKEINE